MMRAHDERRGALGLLKMMGAGSMLLLSGALAFGCKQSSENVESFESETHFLSSCDEGSTCGDGLSCLCGVCTRECDGDSACSGLASGATCAAQGSSGCGAAEMVCDVECDGDADCDEAGLAGSCQSGRCRVGGEIEGSDDAPTADASTDEGELPADDASESNDDADVGVPSDGGQRESESGDTADDAVSDDARDAESSDDSAADDATGTDGADDEASDGGADDGVDLEDCDGLVSGGECLTCNDVATRAEDAAQAVVELEELRSCSVDADCTLLDTGAPCFGGCPNAFSVDSADQARDALDAVSDEYCAGYVDAGCSVAGPSCPTADARCDDGVCVSAERSESGCDSRDFDTCEQDDDCRLLSAHAAWRTDACYVREVMPVACVDASVDACGDDTVLAVDPGGSCWMMTYACIPPGFRNAESGECDEQNYCDEALCWGKASEACGSDPNCGEVSGVALDSSAQCFGDERVIGCATVSDGCLTVITTVVDVWGTCYVLPDACVPPGFRMAMPDECPSAEVSCE